MMRVGFIGWRGMVGSVLLDRMRAEGDFEGIEPWFFSTSSVGGAGPTIGGGQATLLDAYDTTRLKACDVVMTCQGGDYTRRVYPALRAVGWRGYWIDAASSLRMEDDAVLVLDPVNRSVIHRALHDGRTLYCGANCTTSLMLMAIGGLIREGLVAWVSSMTYQAASGAGARYMRELVAQMASVGACAAEVLADPGAGALELDRVVARHLRSDALPTQAFGYPLAASLLPWIDRAVDAGQTREEWKGFVETNKILATREPIAVDGLCVRVGSMRCHAQGLTLKLTREVPVADLEARMACAHPWARVIDNTAEATWSQLTPAAVAGTLDVRVGRVRSMRMGADYVTCFTVGDQLLWGAAEPLRRMLSLVREHVGT